MQRIRNNFGLKLLALALALVGWAYFRFSSNPILAAPFTQQLSVPIAAINLPVGYVVHFTEKQAVVSVTSSRGQPPVKPDEIKAVIDVANRGAGVFNVPVQLVAPQVAVQSLSPASVTLTVEKIDQKAFPVAVHYVGNAGGTVVGHVAITPTVAMARGPSSSLAQVTSLQLDLPMASTASSADEMVRPVPVDALGREVSGVHVSPDLIRVQVQFVEGTVIKHQ